MDLDLVNPIQKGMINSIHYKLKTQLPTFVLHILYVGTNMHMDTATSAGYITSCCFKLVSCL